MKLRQYWELYKAYGTLTTYFKKEGTNMKFAIKNWRTTTPGVIAGIANILPFFGIPIPPGVVNAITTVAIVLIGLLAKDSNVTGGNTKNAEGGM